MQYVCLSWSKICSACLIVFMWCPYWFLDLRPSIIHCHFGSSVALQKLLSAFTHVNLSWKTSQPPSSGAPCCYYCLFSYSSIPLLLCLLCEESIRTKKLPQTSCERRLKVQVCLLPPSMGMGFLSRKVGQGESKSNWLLQKAIIPYYPFSFSWFVAAAYLVI